MKILETSPLNYLHFYNTKNSVDYWQPISVSDYVPCAFISTVQITDLILRVYHNGVIINQQSVTLCSTLNSGESVYVFEHDRYNQLAFNLEKYINEKLIFSIETREGPRNLYTPLMTAKAIVRTFTWLLENCIMLSAQFTGSKFNALGTVDDTLISWHQWFPGTISEIEAVVEDNSNSFRDQGWGTHLVSRKVNKVHTIKIGDAKGVPFWVYESAQAYVSLKTLYLNDSIKVNLSESNSPSISTTDKYDKGFITLGLTEVSSNLKTVVKQLDGTVKNRLNYALTIPSDQNKFSDFFVSKVTVPLMDKIVMTSNNTGLLLYLKSMQTSFIAQTDMPVEVEFASPARQVNIKLKTREGIEHVTVENLINIKPKPREGESLFRLDLVQLIDLRDYLINFYYKFNSDVEEYVPIGLGLLFNPLLMELTISKYITPYFISFVEGTSFDEGTSLNPTSQVSTIYLGDTSSKLNQSVDLGAEIKATVRNTHEYSIASLTKVPSTKNKLVQGDIAPNTVVDNLFDYNININFNSLIDIQVISGPALFIIDNLDGSFISAESGEYVVDESEGGTTYLGPTFAAV